MEECCKSKCDCDGKIFKSRVCRRCIAPLDRRRVWSIAQMPGALSHAKDDDLPGVHEVHLWFGLSFLRRAHAHHAAPEHGQQHDRAAKHRHRARRLADKDEDKNRVEDRFETGD
jgi:hypothetical protein